MEVGLEYPKEISPNLALSVNLGLDYIILSLLEGGSVEGIVFGSTIRVSKIWKLISVTEFLFVSF